MKGDQFTLETRIKYGNFGWTKGLVFVSPNHELVSKVHWMMMTDDPFKLNESLPAWTGVVDPT